MAQIGSYVPASSCCLSVVDQIFSRVGASDNVRDDQSTFFIEMSELSNIIQYATRHSLLIIDEAGRGTSSTEGFSIALSVLEYIHNRIKCRTLFATHYHELSLADKYLNRMKCWKMSVETSEQREEHASSQSHSPASSSSFPHSALSPSSSHPFSHIIFHHKLVPGVVTTSYGIPIARYAGIPDAILLRAQFLLNQLQSTNIQSVYKEIIKQPASV